MVNQDWPAADYTPIRACPSCGAVMRAAGYQDIESLRSWEYLPVDCNCFTSVGCSEPLPKGMKGKPVHKPVQVIKPLLLPATVSVREPRRYRVIDATVQDFCQDYRGEKFHALLCDPPYHLTSITKRFGGANAVPAKFGKDGAFSRASRGFMGQQWDGGDVAFDPDTWVALGEHLYPGAFGMAFASSRGWHRLAVAIEDAGFVIHPSIFGWGFGQGFPKATRIDRQLDGDRDLKGTLGDYKTPDHAIKRKPGNQRMHEGYQRPWRDDPEAEDRNSREYIGADELSQAWSGHRYGLQALRPSLEPIIVFQKPYEGRPVDCITTTGAGAIWIDGARIEGQPEATRFDPAKHKHDGYRMTATGEDIAQNEVGGRWPANLALIHDPRCNGTCVPQEIFSVPVFSFESVDVSPRDDASFLLDRLQSLIELVRRYSTDGNSLLRDAYGFYRNGRKQSAGSSDGLTDEVLCVLEVSKFPDFQFDCPSCRRFCDELLHRVLMACLETPQQLPDVLSAARLSLSEPRHNQHHQSAVRLSSSDDARQLDSAGRTERNRNADTDLLLGHEAETTYCKLGSVHSELPLFVPDVRSPLNNNDADGKHEMRHHIARSAALSKILCFLSFDLAWRFVLPALIIQRKTIVVNFAGCAVRKLGEQSGVSESSGGRSGHTAAYGGGYQREYYGDATPGLGDSGTAARFFYNADWHYEVAEQIANADPVRYVAKASTEERSRGLDNLPWRTVNDGRQTPIDNAYQRGETQRLNTHPTVKPIALAEWLAKLLLPPAAYGTRRLLVPFSGSGSEMIGAYLAGWEQIVGIEMTMEYAQIARARLSYYADPLRTMRTPAEPTPQFIQQEMFA